MGTESHLQPQEPEENPLIKYGRYLEAERSRASESERKVGGIQSIKYETALLRLMRRTGDDANITNALNAFIDALDRKSTYGSLDRGLSGQQTKELGDFLVKTAESLQFDVQWGGRPAEHIAEQWRKDWREGYHLNSPEQKTP